MASRKPGRRSRSRRPEPVKKHSAGRAQRRPKPEAKRDRARRPAPSKARKRIGELVAKVRAKLVVPARRLLAAAMRTWLAIAERAGAVVLLAWRRLLRPLLAALAALARRAYRGLDRRLTPARALGIVCLVALAALVASQWLDYRTIAIGGGAYTGAVEGVAAAPEVGRVQAGDAHAWVILPLALVGIVALVLAFRGRPRAARLLQVVGLVVLVVGLVVDAPAGLDEGETGIAYEGASAALIEGFWVQIAAAAVLIAAGALLPRQLRPEAAATDREPRARRPGPVRRFATRRARRQKRASPPPRPAKARGVEGAKG
jgi:hypothetical protein